MACFLLFVPGLVNYFASEEDEQLVSSDELRIRTHSTGSVGITIEAHPGQRLREADRSSSLNFEISLESARGYRAASLHWKSIDAKPCILEGYYLTAPPQPPERSFIPEFIQASRRQKPQWIRIKREIRIMDQPHWGAEGRYHSLVIVFFNRCI